MNIQKKKDRRYVEIWEDLVYLKELMISILISIGATMSGYFIAPEEESMPLFFGLAGALIGFIISSLIFKPKRQFINNKGEQ